VSEAKQDGLHYVCPDSKFFRYTRTFIDNVMNSLTCISRDGLEITLTLTTQYRLNVEELRNVLFEFGTQEDLDNYIDVIIQDTVRDTCARFDGNQYYTARGDIEANMTANVQQVLDGSNAYVTTGFFQLQNVALPSQLSDAINNKQLALENVEVVTNLRDQILIDAETKLLQAVEEANILIIETQAAADARTTSAQAAADARILVQGTAEAQAIRDVAVLEADARTNSWLEIKNAIVSNVQALSLTPEAYVDEYLTPRLTADVVDPEVSACLAQSTPSTAWWCWVNTVTAGV
jgi:regulator of protease activity HflC (stomatin/prohibitin superfamily)